MKPVKFDLVNKIFKLVGGTSENDLPVFDDGSTLHSAWQPDAGDRQKIARGDALLLSVSGKEHPLVQLQVVDSEEFRRKAKFHVFQGKDRKWYFHLKALNGEIILNSEGYEAKQGAQETITVIKMLAYDAKVVDDSKK